MQSDGEELKHLLVDEAATIAAGRALAAVLLVGAFAVALGGPLGAGKSTFARAVLRALGVSGPVPSPTYTLIEPYPTSRGPAYHVDLYRLHEMRDFEALGLEELQREAALLLVEWPERGASVLSYDLALDFAHAGAARMLNARALSVTGANALAAWRNSFA